MAKLTIDTGTAGNPATGDTLRTAMTKVNANFTEIYNELGSDGTFSNISFDGNTISTDNTNGDLTIDPNGTGRLVIDATITNTTTNANITISPNGTGAVDVDTSRIINVTDPTSAQDAATKNYVDTQLSSSDHNFTFVGDDSTGTAVTQGETFKFAGATGITTAVSGDTLTITGTAQDFAFGSLTGTPTTLSGYGITDAVATGSTAVTVVGDDSTGTGVNIGETFKIAGTQNITTAVSGDTLTITGPDLTSYVQNTDVVFKIGGDDSTARDIRYGNLLIFKGHSSAIAVTTSTNGSEEEVSFNLDFNSSQIVTAAEGIGSNNNDTTLPTSAAVKDYVDAQNTAQALTFVGDDSTGTAVNSGETFKIAGTQNITTAVSGDTLTITGPDLTSYLTTVAFADLTGKPTTLSGYGITDAASSTATAVTLVGDDSTGTAITLGETFKIAGTQNVTTAVSGDTLTITGPDLTSYLTTSGNGSNLSDVSLFTIEDDSSTNPTVNANSGLTIRGDRGIKLQWYSMENLLIVDGSNLLSRLIPLESNSAGYLTGTGTQTIDNLTFNDNIISTSSNADLNLNPGGTGQVVANSALKINKGYIEAINALTSSSTITVDFSTASVHTVTLAENTQFVVTNLPTGGTGTIIITQDGGGTNTGTFGTDGSTAVKFAGGTPTLSTAGGAIDVVTIFNDGTNYLGNIAKAYAA